MYNKEKEKEEEKEDTSMDWAFGSLSFLYAPGEIPNPHFQLLFRSIQREPKATLFRLFERGWKINPVNTVRIMFHLRDYSCGRGYKRPFRLFLEWLQNYDCRTLAELIRFIPMVGAYKDLCYFFGTPFEQLVLTMFARRLTQDLRLVHEAQGEVKPAITRAAKWAPSEGGHDDKQYRVVSKLCKLMGITKQIYRTHYLTPLRRVLSLPETYMCTQQWSILPVLRLPHRFRTRHAKMLHRRLPTLKAHPPLPKTGLGVVSRYNFLIDYEWRQFKSNALYESVWEVFRIGEQLKLRQASANLQRKIPLQYAAVVLDTTPTMIIRGVHILAQYLCLFITALTQSLGTGFFTFADAPWFVPFFSRTLADRVKSIRSAKGGTTINLSRVFDAGLREALAQGKPVPNLYFVLSDVDPEKAATICDVGELDTVLERYQAIVGEVPHLIFWNLKSPNAAELEIRSWTPHVTVINGFTSEVMNMFIQGHPISAQGYMQWILNNPRYKEHLNEITLGMNRCGGTSASFNTRPV